MLRIAKGNMYSFVTHTFNIIKGKCEHDCLYCYMKEFKLGNLHIDRKEFKTDLDEADFVFIGSSTDIWAKNVPKEWIIEVLKYINKFSCRVLFQSKYPQRFKEFKEYLPDKDRLVLGTTIESDIFYPEYMGNTTPPSERVEAMVELSKEYTTMVTVEPIMQFGRNFESMLVLCSPAWINIGFDSKGHHLPEPTRQAVMNLVRHLREVGITVKLKENSKRVLGNEIYARLSRSMDGC